MRKLWAFLGVALMLLAAGCGYDSDRPDTKKNRRLFTSLTGVKADKDIRKVYAYADYFPGIDPLFCLAFEATPEAVARIVKKKQLEKKDREKDGGLWDLRFSVLPSEPWWNAEERDKSTLYYGYDKKHEVGYYLWHDPKTNKCQFLAVCF